MQLPICPASSPYIVRDRTIYSGSSEKEYGTSLSDSVFIELSAKQLAKDGNGVDVSGLKRIHRALEDKIEPVSATLFVWKPSDHSMYGHAALQIGRGRVNVEPDADEIRFFN